MDQMYLQKGVKSIALSHFSIYYTWKNIKTSYGNKKFKMWKRTWVKNLNYLMDLIKLSDIQDYLLSTSSCSMKHWLINRQFRYTSTKFKGVTLKIKTGSCLEHLTPETLKLLGSTEKRITKDKKGERLPQIEVTEVILVHCNIAIINVGMI